MQTSITSRPARLSLDCDDRLTVLEFGVVWHDAAPRTISRLPGGRILYASPAGRAVGFYVDNVHDVRLVEIAGSRTAPVFDVPALGLRHASVDLIVDVARSRYLRRETTCAEGHWLLALEAWIEERSSDAEFHWRRALEAGELRAHRRLGRLLLERGDMKGALEHLRSFTVLDPTCAQGWADLRRAEQTLRRAA